MIGKTVVYLATIRLLPFVAYICFFYIWVLEIDTGKKMIDVTNTYESSYLSILKCRLSKYRHIHHILPKLLIIANYMNEK